MARAFTTAERDAIASDHHDHHAKLELKDSEGNWVDVSSGLDGGSADWFDGASLEENVDSQTMQLDALLLRNHVPLGLSLSPLMTASPLNRDSGDEYAPFLDLAREWRLSVSVVEHGDPPNYKEIGGGTYDVIEIQDPEPQIRILGRDWGSTLLDLYIGVEQQYLLGGNQDLEEVLQEILDENVGVGTITLEVEGGPTGVVLSGPLKLVDMSVMAALNDVAQKAGYVVRYRYNADDEMKLTLYVPDRGAETGDEVWTLGPSEYTRLPLARLDLANVRNRVVVRFLSYEVIDNGVPETVTVEDEDSIDRYGGFARTIYIDLSKDTHIRTTATATAFAEAVLADLSTPPFDQQIVVPGFWIAQLGDFGKLLANDVHYDEDQYGAVNRIRHELANGELTSFLFLGGKPKGQYRAWTALVGTGTGTNNDPTTTNLTASYDDRYVNELGDVMRGTLDIATNADGRLIVPVGADKWAT